MTSRSRIVLAAALVPASVAVGGCGATKQVTILNTEKVERAIERSTLVQRHKRVHQKKGLVFSCTTLLTRGATRFVVTELDGAGQVHYEAP
jgi:hypothetical protein